MENQTTEQSAGDLNARERMWRTGIDEPMIVRLVHAFYGKVRTDALLGPVFDRKVEDWDEHLRTLVAFWSSIAMGTDSYKGRPLPAHMGLGIEAEHFTRWLGLFRETAAEVCPPEAAAFFIGRAETIARSFQMGLDFHRSAQANGARPAG